MAVGDWKSKVLTAEDCTIVENKIAEIEIHTSGEVVPIIVKQTVRPWGLATILTLISYLIILLEFFVIAEPWGDAYHLIALILVLTLPWFFVWFSRTSLALRSLYPDKLTLQAIEQRAELEFYRLRMTHTHKKTGILIYLALKERRVVILADEGISKAVPADFWKEEVALIVPYLKKDQVKDGMLRVIEGVGEKLKTHFPFQGSHNANEIPNKVLFKDN